VKQGSKADISAIGGMESVVEMMKMFPKCQALQESAFYVLVGLACSYNIGKKKAIETGGFEVLLAALHKHMISLRVCETVFDAMETMIEGNKKHTKRFMNAGGVTALTKVREEWPDKDDIQERVQNLTKLIMDENEELDSNQGCRRS
jgi:hypothetical protein